MLRRDDYIKMLEKRAAATTEKEYMDRANHWGHVGGAIGGVAGAAHGIGRMAKSGPAALLAAPAFALGGMALGEGAGRLAHGAIKGHEYDALGKHASISDGGKTGPTFDHDVNSGEVANAEHRKNLGDSRETLGKLFTNMGEASRVETRFAKKWFPSEKFEKDTSSPLIKVAMAALSESGAFRGYPAHYKAAAIRGFINELEVIKTGG